MSSRRRSFTTRFWDFWLLGGFSIAVFALMMFYPVPVVSLLMIVPFVQLLIEFPHLMAPYRMAYARGPEFIRAHYFVMVAAPVLLVVTATVLTLLPPEQSRGGWTMLVALIFLAVGYHRARQVYGIMVIYAGFDEYPLLPVQKKITSLLLNVIWLTGYIHMNAFPRDLSFFGISVPQWPVPDWLMSASSVIMFTAVMTFFCGVLLFNFMRSRALPSPIFLVPLVAIVVWFWSYSVSPVYYLFLTAAFHSLQYLTCVAGYGREERSWSGYLGASVILVIASFFVMRLLPRQFDALFGLGVLGIYIFVSLHHYLLDSIIWRTSDPRIRRNIMGRSA